MTNILMEIVRALEIRNGCYSEGRVVWWYADFLYDTHRAEPRSGRAKQIRRVSIASLQDIVSTKCSTETELQDTFLSSCLDQSAVRSYHLCPH